MNSNNNDYYKLQTYYEGTNRVARIKTVSYQYSKSILLKYYKSINHKITDVKNYE